MPLNNHNASSQGNITVTIKSKMPLINNNARSQFNITFTISMARPLINHNAMATNDSILKFPVDHTCTVVAQKDPTPS
jgi:hypothetical protein